MTVETSQGVIPRWTVPSNESDRVLDVIRDVLADHEATKQAMQIVDWARDVGAAPPFTAWQIELLRRIPTRERS
jgi:hypothetical protein